MAGDFDGERAVPAAGVAAHRRGQDSSGPGLQAAGQFAGRLVRRDRGDPGQGHHAYGRSQARITPVVNRTLGVVRRRALKRGNPTVRPARLPDLESAQFVRRTGYTVQASVERLCAALTPPRGDLGFGGVPGATQRGQVPSQRSSEVLTIHAVGAFGASVGRCSPSPPASAQLTANRPRPRVTFQITGLRGARVQREPVRPHQAWQYSSNLAVGGDRYRFRRSTRCRTASVQAGTQRGENLGDIANQVIANQVITGLGRIQHDNPPAHTPTSTRPDARTRTP